MKQSEQTFDAVIVGGGPGGLTAALYLGRARKRVLVIDAHEPRHAASKAIHNFVTRDGMAPAEFRRVAWEQMAAYPNVQREDTHVTSIDESDDRCVVRTATAEFTARAVLLALGVTDELPQIPGFAEFWGTGIFQCPFCHGWEVRDRSIALCIPPHMAAPMVRLCRGWSEHLTLVTNGLPMEPHDLDGLGVPVHTQRFRRIFGIDGRLQGIEFVDRSRIEIDAMVFHGPQHQAQLVHDLDLELDEHGFVVVTPEQRTSRRLIWAAGDMTTMRQQVVNAAAQGGTAGGMITMFLAGI